MIEIHKNAQDQSNLNTDIKLTQLALDRSKTEPKQLEVVVWLERLCKELKQHVQAF